MSPTSASSTVTVTGRGAVTAAGPDIEALFSAVSAGRSALASPAAVADADLMAGVIGEVQAEWEAPAEPRIVSLALTAARAALADSRLEPSDGFDLVVGTGSGARQASDWQLVGRPAPPGSMQLGEDRFGVVAEHLRRALGGSGRQVTINTACSAGANAVVHGWSLIAGGRCDRVLCVGVEEFTAGLHFAFQLMSALSSEPCQPFLNFSGTTLGEGAGAVVLERVSTAMERGAPDFGHILGVGQSADAFNLARPDPTGAGPALAIERALHCAGLRGTDPHVVIGHGTGTAANDRMELSLHERSNPAASLIGLKGLIGHTVAASGIVELIVLLEILAGRLVPSAICQASPETPFKDQPTLGVKNSYAMGGLDTSLVCGATDSNVRRKVSLGSEGVVASTFWRTGSAWLSESDLGEVNSRREQWCAAISPLSLRNWNRLDLLGKMVLVAVAGVLEPICDVVPSDDVGLNFATCNGPVLSWAANHDALLGGRPQNPALIPRLSYNAAPSAAAEVFGLRGPSTTFVSRAGVALGALEGAQLLLERGVTSAMVIVACDEYTGPLVLDDGLHRLGGIDPSSPGIADVHVRVGAPMATPAVAAVLLVQRSLARRMRWDVEDLPPSSELIAHASDPAFRHLQAAGGLQRLCSATSP